MKNVTITLDEETAKWTRVHAAERDMSLSRFVGEVLRAGGNRQRQRENQAAGLLEEPVVVAGHVHQLRKPVAHLDVALAQDLHLPLHQRGKAKPSRSS